MPKCGVTVFFCVSSNPGLASMGPAPIRFFGLSRIPYHELFYIFWAQWHLPGSQLIKGTLNSCTIFASKQCNTEGVCFNSILMYYPPGMPLIVHPSEEDEEFLRTSFLKVNVACNSFPISLLMLFSYTTNWSEKSIHSFSIKPVLCIV